MYQVHKDMIDVLNTTRQIKILLYLFYFGCFLSHNSTLKTKVQKCLKVSLITFYNYKIYLI